VYTLILTRGELLLTYFSRIYQNKKQLKVNFFPIEINCLNTGILDLLQEAVLFIKSLERKLALRICSSEVKMDILQLINGKNLRDFFLGQSIISCVFYLINLLNQK
tara:strand:- start:17311 stop:17628 length:318 start_codon:yes stop_codon:yes gene_type:complete